MKTTTTSTSGPITSLTASDRKRVGQILSTFGAHAHLEPLGGYQSMSSMKVWSAIVSQFCVMGSARGMETITRDATRRAEFDAATDLSELAKKRFRVEHLADVLRSFSATRFPKRAATGLKVVFDTPTAVQDGKCIILAGLSHEQPPSTVRDTLIARCPAFKLKSASDFMITTGLSHDVVALDTRVVGALRKYLGYNLKVGHVQGRREVYHSVESALRDACEAHEAKLARLDRVLFQFSGISALDFALRLM